MGLTRGDGKKIPLVCCARLLLETVSFLLAPSQLFPENYLKLGIIYVYAINIDIIIISRGLYANTKEVYHEIF